MIRRLVGRALVLLALLATSFAPAHPARAAAWPVDETPPAAPRDTVFFSSRPDAGTPDGTRAHPYRDIVQVPAMLQPGRAILLERGSIWYEPHLSWDFSHKHGSADAPMLVGAYGDSTAPRPVVSSLVRLETGRWTDEGNDVHVAAQVDSTWQEDHVIRLYLGGMPLMKVPSPDSLVDGTYCVSDGRIRVKSPDFSSRPWVETLQALPNVYCIVHGQDVDHLTIADLELKGSAAWCAVLFGAPTSAITLRNLRVREFRGYGIEFRVEGHDRSKVNRDVSVLNCRIDKGWSPGMNDEYRHWVYSAPDEKWLDGARGTNPGGAGVVMAEGVDGAIIRGCYVTNMGHTGICSEYHDSTLTNYGVHNMLVEMDTVTAGTSSYCRGLGFGPLPNTMGVFRRNWVFDVNISSQFKGDSTYVYGNIFDGTRDSPVPLAYCHSTSDAIDVGMNIANYATALTTNTVIANNTFLGAAGFLVCENDPEHRMKNDVFANNLCVGWRPYLAAWSRDDCANVDAAVYFGSTEVTAIRVDSNGFWRTAADTAVFAIRAKYPNADRYSPASLNAFPFASGNRLGDPGFVAAAARDPAGFALSDASPYRAGGVPLAELLPPGIEAVDFFGVPFARSPSLGAIQYRAPGTR